ncbi:MAG: cobalamin biosynthesis protein CobQ [Halocynthiibacter sp.]
MITTAHILLGGAVLSRRGEHVVAYAAFAGGLVPDLSLFAMAGWNLLVLDVPPQTVFGVYYFTENWRNVFAIDNSIPLWSVLLGVALWRGNRWLTVFSGGALLHVGADFLLHNTDARPNFWPISNWLFRSPVSYWDPAYYGAVFAPIETAILLLAAVVLLRRFRQWDLRAFTILIAGVQLLPIVLTGGFHGLH